MSLKTSIIPALCLIVHSGLSALDTVQVQAEETAQTAVQTTVKKTDKSVKVIKRGSALPKGKYLSLDDVSAQPEKFADKAVLLTGKVDSVCRVKGCWMIIASEKSKAHARITFKDYAFFVPKDASGMKSKMSGIVKIKTLSEGERQHLADDGKVDVSEIPKVELRIMADGVELYPQG
jgi:hypothetical protein